MSRLELWALRMTETKPMDTRAYFHHHIDEAKYLFPGGLHALSPFVPSGSRKRIRSVVLLDSISVGLQLGRGVTNRG